MAQAGRSEPWQIAASQPLEWFRSRRISFRIQCFEP
jgi:hypothetical protein